MIWVSFLAEAPDDVGPVLDNGQGMLLQLAIGTCVTLGRLHNPREGILSVRLRYEFRLYCYRQVQFRKDYFLKSWAGQADQHGVISP